MHSRTAEKGLVFYKRYTVNSLLYKMDTSLRQTLCVGPSRFSVILQYLSQYKTNTCLRRTTDTLKSSTDTFEIVVLVRITSKRNLGAENGSKLQIMEAKFLFHN